MVMNLCIYPMNGSDSVWFLNPDQLPALILEHKKVLTPDQVNELSYCIYEYICSRQV